jgi:hypothetical protein
MAQKGLELTADHVKEIKAAMRDGTTLPTRGLHLTMDPTVDGYWRKMTTEEQKAHDADDVDPATLDARKNPPTATDNP